ncbi:putative dsRNA-binding protein, partial [Paraburkholderia sp.]|uniref:putative dsRNA-binding protein n=1 Tax=Paraburkholderia sp. TaxID=1926495 RepID=UPI002D56B3C3
LYVPILDHIDPRTLGKDSKTLLQEYLQGHKIALPTYTVVATHGAAHNQQFEVECTVPKLDVKVSGSGASRRAAEQAAAKKALDEVMAAAPAVVAKPKRSKGARSAKNVEQEIVPGVTGVQAALDLRSPDRKSERGARPAPAVEYADERPTLTTTSAPLAVIRAAHVEYSGQDKSERADRAERADKAASHSSDRSADKAVTDKPAEKLDAKSAEVRSEGAKPADAKPADAKPEAAAVRSADKHRSREVVPGAAVPTPGVPAPIEDEPGVVGAVQTRVADAGH